MDGIDATLKKCDYCSFSFVGHAKYYNHARKDHSDIVARTWEACSKCAKRFPDKKALVSHRPVRHFNANPLDSSDPVNPKFPKHLGHTR